MLLARINSEPLGIDLAMLFMEDDVLADAIIARHKGGLLVRVLVEPRRNQTTPKNEEILARIERRRHPHAGQIGRRGPALEVHDLRWAERVAVQRRELLRLLLQAHSPVRQLHR